MYLQGRGAPGDRVKGLAWIMLAAANGAAGAAEAHEAALATMSEYEIALATDLARRLALASRATRDRLAEHE